MAHSSQHANGLGHGPEGRPSSIDIDGRQTFSAPESAAGASGAAAGVAGAERTDRRMSPEKSGEVDGVKWVADVRAEPMCQPLVWVRLNGRTSTVDVAEVPALIAALTAATAPQACFNREWARRALSLLDAATKAERAKRVVGWRVKSREVEHAYSLGPDKAGLDYVGKGHLYADRAKALRDVREWNGRLAGGVRYGRLVRVTRRVKP